LTPANFRIATARKLRILADGGSLGAEEDDKLITKYAGLHAMLQGEELAPFEVDDDVPENCQEPMIDMLAALSVEEFAIPEPRRSTLLMFGSLFMDPMSPAERRLRKVLATKYVSQTLSTDYY
jgi:hypothetical protein